jgi:hypothetical protein
LIAEISLKGPVWGRAGPRTLHFPSCPPYKAWLILAGA